MKTFKLENEPKIEPGFKTPDHYFENFSIKMMEQLPVSEPKVISIFQKRKLLILLSTAAVLIFALLIPILSPTESNTKELDTVDIENYITYQSNVNQYDLIIGLETEDIEKINSSIVLEDETIEDHLSTNSNLENLILE
jgi:short subunit fatty acids transporter